MQELKLFDEFIFEILQNNSRNYKLDVLKRYKDNDTIKYFLKFVYDPFLVTGISSKKLTKPVIEIANHFNTARELLEYILLNNTGKDAVISEINAFKREKLFNNSQLCELLDSIICKNIPLGVDSLSINKCIPNLCSTFNVQLAEKYFEHPEVVEGKEFAITTKIDGMRCIMLKENGNVTFWSRQGQKIEGLVDLEEEAKSFPDNVALDGELVAAVDNPDTYKDTIKRARTKDTEKHGLKMKVFDYMTAEGFRNQNYKDHYLGRRADLMHTLNKPFIEDCILHGIEFDKQTLPDFPYLPTDKTEYAEHNFNWNNDQVHFINQHYKYFEVLPILYQGKDTSKIIELLEEQTSKGEEGIMINICNAVYNFKRTRDLLKCKLMKSYDLRVVGFEEGTHSNKGKLGALLCSYKGNIVKVGSGFTNSEIYDKDGNLIQEDERKEIWNNQDKYLNLIADIQYFEETTNQEGGQSLRFPVFRSFRDDKIEADF